MKNKIWLSSPHIDSIEQQNLIDLFDTNHIADQSSAIVIFESKLAKYLGQHKSVIALNSGTSAIHLALILAGVKKNDVVICQSFTFAASANPILYQGATPVFVDSEPTTWNMCPKHLENAIISETKKGKKPKAIIAMHTYGMPYQVDAINAISEKYNIPIIEDAASALGSTFKGKKCGTFGDFGIISFNDNKIITTLGGGVLICNDAETKNKALFLATQAKETVPHYQHNQIGFNYRINRIAAAIGTCQLEVLDDRIIARNAMHQFYQQIFAKIKSVTLFETPSDAYSSNYWLSTILLQNYEEREALRLHLESENIESRPVWKPLHLQPVFEIFPYYGNQVSEDLFERGLCLPSGSNLNLEAKNSIQSALHTFFKK
jgi:dTDP-4-amino-4,6-dideoxygalactose transaminase